MFTNWLFTRGQFLAGIAGRGRQEISTSYHSQRNQVRFCGEERRDRFTSESEMMPQKKTMAMKKS